MSSTILNLATRSPIDGTEYLVLATPGANWKAQLTGQQWIFAGMEIGADKADFFTLAGAASLGFPSISVTGSDTNISMVISAKNSGTVVIQSGNGNALTVQSAGGTTFNGIQIVGAATGNPPSVFATGGDTNINLVLGGQGTGNIQFTTPSFTANGTTATLLGSVGPAGANTTVQEWLTILDASGNTRYIPCF